MPEQRSRDCDPALYLRRSPLYRILQQAGAIFTETPRRDAAVVRSLGTGTEVEQARHLGMADLSPLPRCGFKGARALQWLEMQNINVPRNNHQALPQENGLLVARLSDQEVLILTDPGAEDSLVQIETTYAKQAPAYCHAVPWRDSSAWLRVSGKRAGQMFAKLCGVDLLPDRFPNLTLAQTSMARMNIIVIRDDPGTTSGWHLLFDSASAEYLWNCLQDAGAEFNLVLIGLDALIALNDCPG